MLWCADLRASMEAGGSAAPPPGAAIAACDWVPELDALCLALSSGELLLLDAAQQAAVARAGAGAAAVEEVGAVDGGLAAAAWSPDGELLVLVTGTAQLLLMNKVRQYGGGGRGAGVEGRVLVELCMTRGHAPQPCTMPCAGSCMNRIWLAGHNLTKWHPAFALCSQNWELLAEVPLLQHKEVAGPADPAPEQPPQLVPGSVCVTWRGDGRYFATASLDGPGASSAMLRIWERDTAELHAQGQPESSAAALLPAAAWQPNGRHLYVAAARREKGGEAAAAPEAVLTADEAEQARQAAAEGIAHVGAWKRELRRRQQARAAAAGSDAPEASVLLFERNGLQHGSFELPPAELDGCAIEQLAWSPDSEFLAVVLSEADEDGEWRLPPAVLCRVMWLIWRAPAAAVAAAAGCSSCHRRRCCRCLLWCTRCTAACGAT